MYCIVYLYTYGVHSGMKHHMDLVQYVIFAVSDVTRIQTPSSAACPSTGAWWRPSESRLTGAHPPPGVIAVRTTALHSNALAITTIFISP